MSASTSIFQTRSVQSRTASRALVLLAALLATASFLAARAEEPDEITKILISNGAQLKERAAAINRLKKQRITDYEKALQDYNAATDLNAVVQDIEAGFRSYLRQKFNSDRFTSAQFNEYFTDDYLRNYNAQFLKQQQTMAQYRKVLQEGDARNEEALAKIKSEIDLTNVKLAEAKQPEIEFPAADAETDKRLAHLRARAAALPERLVAMDDIRSRIGVKDEINVSTAPPVVRPPPVRVAPPVVSPPVVSPPIVSPPVVSAPPVVAPPTVVVPAVVSTDCQGIWMRLDKKVSWRLDAGGVMIVREREKDKKLTPGSWNFDVATSTLTIVHEGVLSKFAVSREGDQFFMVGGAGGSTLRFFRMK